MEAAIQEFIEQHRNRGRNKHILDMVLYKEHSCEETAEILGLKAPLVSYVVREARKFLKERFPHRSSHFLRKRDTSEEEE